MSPVNTRADRLLSIDELDRNIVSLAARINASTYELLVLVRQFDERAVPSCGYQTQDMIDDDIGDIDYSTGELSKLINYPSAEGFLSKVKTSADHHP